VRIGMMGVRLQRSRIGVRGDNAEMMEMTMLRLKGACAPKNALDVQNQGELNNPFILAECRAYSRRSRLVLIEK